MVSISNSSSQFLDDNYLYQPLLVCWNISSKWWNDSSDCCNDRGCEDDKNDNNNNINVLSYLIVALVLIVVYYMQLKTLEVFDLNQYQYSLK